MEPISSYVIEESIEGADINIRTEPAIALPNNSFPSGEPTPGMMKIVGPITFDFFGQQIEVPDTEQVFNGVELIRRESDETSSYLTLKGKEEAILTRRKVA